MNKIEELGMEIARLKVVEEQIINEMRVVSTMVEKVELLCALEVVRFDIKSLYDNYVRLMKDKMISEKENV